MTAQNTQPRFFTGLFLFPAGGGSEVFCGTSQVTWHTPVGVSMQNGKYFFLNQSATLTRLINTGTSTKGPITAAKASPESILEVGSVFLQQDIGVLFAGAFRRRNKVFFRLEPVDDLCGGFIGRLSAFSVKFSHDLVQTIDADLCIIGKFQRAPSNWRRRRDSSIFSSALFILETALGIPGHIAQIFRYVLIFLRHLSS